MSYASRTWGGMRINDSYRICYLWMIRWPGHYEKKDSKSHRTIILTQWVLVNVAWGPSFFHDRFHTDMNGKGICGYNIGLNSYFVSSFVHGLYLSRFTHSLILQLTARYSVVVLLWALKDTLEVLFIDIDMLSKLHGQPTYHTTPCLSISYHIFVLITTKLTLKL